MLALIAIAIFVALLFAGNKAVEPQVDSYFNLANAGDYASLYASLHPKFQEGTTQDQFATFAKGVTDVLGKYKSKSVRGINMQANGGVTQTVASYLAQFENGDATVTFTIMDSKVLGVNFFSPLLESTLKCPHCGVTMKQFSRYCPNCGKPLQETTP